MSTSLSDPFSSSWMSNLHHEWKWWKQMAFSSLPQSTASLPICGGHPHSGWCKTAESDFHSSPLGLCHWNQFSWEHIIFSSPPSPPLARIFLTDTSKGVPAKLQIKICYRFSHLLANSCVILTKIHKRQTPLSYPYLPSPFQPPQLRSRHLTSRVWLTTPGASVSG